MGGGNGQKSAIARAKAQAKAKAAAGAGSQLKNNAAALSIICQICRSTFLCTSTRPKLEEHRSSKHDKHAFEACFPGFAG